MVSLWGNKSQDGDDEIRNDGGAAEVHPAVARPRSRTPDERTRLLAAPPRPSRGDGYLDPDDPAVSGFSSVTRPTAETDNP